MSKTPVKEYKIQQGQITSWSDVWTLQIYRGPSFPTVTVPLSEAKNHSRRHSGTDFLSMLEYIGRKITEESRIRSDPSRKEVSVRGKLSA